MVKVCWTTQAVEDLHSIFEYISKDSRKIARLFAQRIYDHTDQLVEFPNSGRSVPEVENDNIRELIFKNYRIVYKIENDKEVRILTVFNASKLLDTKKID